MYSLKKILFGLIILASIGIYSCSEKNDNLIVPEIEQPQNEELLKMVNSFEKTLKGMKKDEAVIQKIEGGPNVTGTNFMPVDCSPEGIGLDCIAFLDDHTEILTTPEGCVVAITMNVGVCYTFSPLTIHVTFELVSFNFVSVNQQCFDFVTTHPGGISAGIDAVMASGQAAYEVAIMQQFSGDLNIDDCSNPQVTVVADYFQATCQKRCFAGFDLDKLEIIWEDRNCSDEGCCINSTFYCLQNGQIVSLGTYTEVVSASDQCELQNGEPCFQNPLDEACRVRGCIAFE